MNAQHDLTVILRSRFPIFEIGTLEDARVIGLLEGIANGSQRTARARHHAVMANG